MALPASGAIGIGNVQTEFGGTNPAGMSEYYSGGAYVPAGTTGGNGSDGVSAGTVIPTSGTIKLANFYNATTAPASMTIGAKTVTYTAGKTFEYYDSVVTSPASDVNITVTQDRACTISLCGAGGESMGSSGSGGVGGGSQTLTFSFTFKAGVTYVLRLGAVKGGGSANGVAGWGGGYSALYLGSASTSNIIAIVGGGGGGGLFSAGTYTTGTGGGSGFTGPTSVTNGIAWTGAGAGAFLAANRGGGAQINAGGTAGTGTANGTAGGAYSAGSGSAASGNFYGGGGGDGFYGGGGGGASAGSNSAGGGGGAASFLYTAADSSGKTAVYSSSLTGSGGTNFSSSTSRIGFTGRGGVSGNNTNSGARLQYWGSFGFWWRPYPGGSGSAAMTYDCVLQQDVVPGAQSISLAFRVVTSASSLASSSTLTFGQNLSRLSGTGSSTGLEFTIGGTTYTKIVSTVTTSTFNLTTTLGVAVPAGQEIYIYPIKSTTSTQSGAMNVTTAFPTSSFSCWRIAEPSGTYVYGWFPAAAGFTGGGTAPLIATLATPIYPTQTIPKGSIVQRSSNNNADTGTSYTQSTMQGACPGVIRITMT